VLEASAGTGKTYTIAALAARFVAEASRSSNCCW
jgi:ATP-dependent exoDNAse (exonuclease V) beta subunit